MSDRFYVYEHWRPDEGVIFYVGKGQKRRAWDMHRGRNRWHKFIIAKMKAEGTPVEVRIVERFEDEGLAFVEEIERISQYRRLGADLVNLTDGGDGPSGYKFSDERKRAAGNKSRGRKHTPEAKAKIAASAIGNTRGLGKKRPKHAIDATAAFHRGRPKSEEHKAKMREIRQANPTFKGKTHTEAWRAMMSESQKGIPKPEWVKEKMRKPKGEDHKRKLSALMTGVKRSDETRKKISEISKAQWAKRRADGTLEDHAKKIAEGIRKAKSGLGG